MFTALYINFSDVQGQITLVLVVVSGRNSNSSKLLCMSSLPARIRLIKLKMKELECSQDFSHRLIMGKGCLHFFLAVLDRILFILAGNDNMHESLGEFEIWLDLTTGFHGNR